MFGVGGALATTDESAGGLEDEPIAATIKAETTATDNAPPANPTYESHGAPGDAGTIAFAVPGAASTADGTSGTVAFGTAAISGAATIFGASGGTPATAASTCS